MPRIHIFKSIISVGMAIGIAITASTFGIQISTERDGFSVAQTKGMNNRKDRRDDRQGDRTDRRDDRQDCRQAEGVGKDKRDCKQEERQDRNNDNAATTNDG